MNVSEVWVGMIVELILHLAMLLERSCSGGKPVRVMKVKVGTSVVEGTDARTRPSVTDLR